MTNFYMTKFLISVPSPPRCTRYTPRCGSGCCCICFFYWSVHVTCLLIFPSVQLNIQVCPCCLPVYLLYFFSIFLSDLSLQKDPRQKSGWIQWRTNRQGTRHHCIFYCVLILLCIDPNLDPNNQHKGKRASHCLHPLMDATWGGLPSIAMLLLYI